MVWLGDLSSASPTPLQPQPFQCPQNYSPGRSTPPGDVLRPSNSYLDLDGSILLPTILCVSSVEAKACSFAPLGRTMMAISCFGRILSLVGIGLGTLDWDNHTIGQGNTTPLNLVNCLPGFPLRGVMWSFLIRLVGAFWISEQLRLKKPIPHTLSDLLHPRLSLHVVNCFT